METQLLRELTQTLMNESKCNPNKTIGEFLEEVNKISSKERKERLEKQEKSDEWYKNTIGKCFIIFSDEGIKITKVIQNPLEEYNPKNNFRIYETYLITNDDNIPCRITTGNINHSELGNPYVDWHPKNIRTIEIPESVFKSVSKLYSKQVGEVRKLIDKLQDIRSSKK